MGYVFLKKLKVPRLRVFEATGPEGKGVFLVRGTLLGPSWPSLAWYFESQGIEFRLLDSGGIWLVLELTGQIKLLLPQVSEISRSSSRQQVYLPKIGFMPSDIKKRLDLRIILAPTLILGITLLIAVLRPIATEVPIDKADQEPEIDCAMDLDSKEFDNWLEQSVFDSLAKVQDQLIQQTDLGLLNLNLESSLGSTRLYAGYLECQDGRSLELNFRADSSATGNLVQLGGKLDP